MRSSPQALLTPQPPKIIELHERNHVFFGANQRIHHKRAPSLRFSIGQVVRHRLGFKAVVIGWDEFARAPSSWLVLLYPRQEREMVGILSLLLSLLDNTEFIASLLHRKLGSSLITACWQTPRILSISLVHFMCPRTSWSPWRQLNWNRQAANSTPSSPSFTTPSSPNSSISSMEWNSLLGPGCVASILRDEGSWLANLMPLF